MSKSPEQQIGPHSRPDVLPAIGVHALDASNMDERLFHEGSTSVGGQRKYETISPYYDRDLSMYTLELNSPVEHRETIFNIEDWKDKTMLDIGSGGFDRFGIEARQKGVRVVSVNPSLKNADDRQRLGNFIVEANDELVTNEHQRKAKLGWLQRLRDKSEAPVARTESIAALGQSLPFRDNSFDCIVSVYGVPHYLHHVDATIEGDAERISSYTAEIREKDAVLIAQALTDIVRVLKPGGKAYLKDDHRAPGQTEHINAYAPSDGTEVTEALSSLSGVSVEIHEKEMTKHDPFRAENYLAGVERVIVITKASTPNHNSVIN